MTEMHNYFGARRHLLAGYHRKIKVLGSYVVAPQTALIYAYLCYLHPCWQSLVLALGAAAMGLLWVVGFHLSDRGEVERGVPLVAVPGIVFCFFALLLRENRGIAEAVALVCLVVYVSVFTQGFLIRATILAGCALVLGLVLPLLNLVPQMPMVWYEQLAVDLAYVVAIFPVVYYFLGGGQSVSQAIFQESEAERAKNTQIVDTVRRIEPALASAIEAIEETANMLSVSSEQQGRASHAVNQTTDQIVTLVGRSVSAAESTQAMAAEIQADAVQSRTKLSAVEQRFQEAVGRGESMHAQIEDLASQISLTETVNRTMGEIADNLAVLTINASLEAATAGEHGRGFAVVAQELRRLIAQTGTDLTSSRKLLAEIRYRAADISRDAEKSTAQLRHSFDELRQTAALVERIILGFMDTATAVGGIAQTAQEQRGCIKDIGEAMGGLEAATIELKQVVELLRETVQLIVGTHAELREVIANR